MASAADGRLARRLGLRDAVVIGLGSMVGAGVFVAFAPAADAAGPALLLALAVAAIVAYANATSSARLAAMYPESGGTYVYGRERLGPFWGYLAGWAFVVGKTASCAGMALTVGYYAAPGFASLVGVAAVAVLTGLDYRGVQKSAMVTRATATLGEEVRDPARTIPLAIPVALGIALAAYAAVGVALLAVLGPDGISATSAPLAAAAKASGWAWVETLVRVGAVVAAVGSLLSLLLGVSRTTLAMARDGHLPRTLAAVHPRFRVPHHAELAVGAVVIVVVLLADVRSAIGFSSFAVLAYYAVANASAMTVRPTATSVVVPTVGLVGCVALAVSLPWESTVVGLGVLVLGALVWVLRRARTTS